MSLNKSRREYVEYLHTLQPEQLCWCGRYPVAECGKWCERHGRGLTNADRIRESCVECGSMPASARWKTATGTPKISPKKRMQHRSHKRAGHGRDAES